MSTKSTGRRTHINIDVELDFILLIWRMVLGGCNRKDEFRSCPATCTDRCEKWGVAYFSDLAIVAREQRRPKVLPRLS
jgi:hypothetical protein